MQVGSTWREQGKASDQGKVATEAISESGQQHIVRNFAYFKKPRKAAKSHTTDLNQAEDIPPLGSAPLPDP